MKKSDLKDGMIVELRNGKRRLVWAKVLYNVNDTGSKLYIANSLDGYDEALLNKYNRDLDIMEVTYDNKSLWEREQTDWNKVPLGTKVICWDFDGETPHEGRFIRYRGYESIHKFEVLVEDDIDICWKYCELAEKPKEEVSYKELKKEYLDFMEPEVYGYDCDEEEIECLTEWLLNNYNVTRK